MPEKLPDPDPAYPLAGISTSDLILAMLDERTGPALCDLRIAATDIAERM